MHRESALFVFINIQATTAPKKLPEQALATSLLSETGAIREALVMDFTVRIRNTNLSSNAHWSVALARFQFFEAAQKSNCLLTYSEFNILLDLRKMELTPYCGTECILSVMDNSTKQPMTISRLTKASGVGVETVRFYQRKGILETPESMSGYRT